jgi:hypothetical protein
MGKAAGIGFLGHDWLFALPYRTQVGSRGYFSFLFPLCRVMGHDTGEAKVFGPAIGGRFGACASC